MSNHYRLSWAQVIALVAALFALLFGGMGLAELPGATTRYIHAAADDEISLRLDGRLSIIEATQRRILANQDKILTYLLEHRH
jgi:hypothetical protein